MASLIDSLIEVLNNENTEYEKLIELSKDKTSAIVNGNVDRLQELLGSEQRIIDSIDKLDAIREGVVKDICKVLHLNPDEIKVGQIVVMLEKKPAEHDALQSAHLQLKRTIDSLIKINENNKILLKESMDMIEFELNLARNAKVAPQTANYGKGAYEQQGYASGGFDAKQ